jgi:hypothetical protein
MKSIMETHILNLIDANYGLKGVDLVNKVMSMNLNITKNEVMDIIFDMIQEGMLIEIELVFPNNVSKSFIIPKNTKVNVIRRR